ncbi:MAG: carbonic anhydrase, partial [Planctomycetota bacterium]
ETIASIEYAVANLDSVKAIIVLGHEDCGAVKAAMAKPADLGYNLNQLLHQIRPGLGNTKQVTKAVENNAVYQAEQLIANSEIVQKALKKVPVIPAIYRIKTGEVDYLEMPKKK